MGSIAKGKVNASEAEAGMRIIVAMGGQYEGDTIRPSRNKTGEGVTATTVTGKGKVNGRRGYVIETNVGSFYAEPIQTMWLAPEDPAGIKRAYAEALIEDAARPVAEPTIETVPASEEAGAAPAAEEFTPAEREELAANFRTSGALDDAHAEALEIGSAQELTLNSHAGKVVHMSSEGTATMTGTREATGSAVVLLMERVHARIRQNHPEVPAVVIVTGAGIGAGSNKWGHFRPLGWEAKSEEGISSTRIHEMFMAGETLAKGARQVLQTMLHESAHAVAETRGVQDTSRQGRWHNKLFLATAREMGLEYRKPQANPQIGYSEVVLTDETVDEYADLLDALETEIHLMVRLPGWLGGQDDNGESNGGEGMGQAPKGPAAPNTNNIKCVCRCEEPNIIRMSRKVLDQEVVNCGDCDSLFQAA